MFAKFALVSIISTGDSKNIGIFGGKVNKDVDFDQLINLVSPDPVNDLPYKHRARSVAVLYPA